MHDDDGNELWDYRSRIYNRQVISVFIKEAESLLGNLIYFRKRFTGEGFPEKAEAVAFEGLTEDESNTLDHLERCMHDKALMVPKWIKW
jgi:hypothetical protein|tara:strand:- start:173 stop:439 length:267 start_codon:yes stop_codon:yes gene_type:complete